VGLGTIGHKNRLIKLSVIALSGFHCIIISYVGHINKDNGNVQLYYSGPIVFGNCENKPTEVVRGQIFLGMEARVWGGGATFLGKGIKRLAKLS
jgi:hypothetical protein